MAADRTDEYIAEHARSMSQQEIADKLGVNKSTVSRRMKAMRERGTLPAGKERRLDRREEAARETLRDKGITRAERIAALSELKDILHAELELSGGAGLARVSSEYRQTIEQIEALSDGLEVEIAKTNTVSLFNVTRTRSSVRKACQGAEHQTVNEVFNATLAALHDIGIIHVDNVDALRGKKPEKMR